MLQKARATTDELAEAILDELQPFKDGCSRENLTSHVMGCINGTRDTARVMGISAQQQRRAKAKAISKAAAKLLAEIDPLILHLIEPLPLAPPRELGVSPELLPLGTKLGELAPKAELDSFRTLLRGIEREFTRVGAAAATEKLRLWCARDAAEMIRRFSEKPPTSGNAKSPFRAVTSLLFEAATGRPRIDLERACEAVLAEAVLAHGARTPASAIFPVTTRHRPKRRASMAARISRPRD